MPNVTVRHPARHGRGGGRGEHFEWGKNEEGNYKDISGTALLGLVGTPTNAHTKSRGGGLGGGREMREGPREERKERERRGDHTNQGNVTKTIYNLILNACINILRGQMKKEHLLREEYTIFVVT